MRFSAFSAGFVASVVGFGGTLALILAAAEAVGATTVQTASWVTAISLAIAIETLWLSWRFRMPIVAAWSAAGLALVGASQGFTINDAAGAFLLAGLMLLATGLFKPLTRLVEHIPQAVSAGMLGGILLPFVLAAVKASGLEPAFVLPLVLLFFVVRVFSPSAAVIVVLAAGVLIATLTGQTTGTLSLRISTLTLVRPDFSMTGFFGLSLPLYLVTMASQNLPGLAVLRASGYAPPAGYPVAVTGGISALTSIFGASTTNLSAITAAICTGEDAHPDPGRRWHTGLWYAGCYFVFALFGASLVAIVAAMPASLIMLVTGLALLAPLANATTIAMRDDQHRVAAIATFAVTASGIAFFGVGAAFWGLLSGLVIIFLPRLDWRKLQ
ncbi:benzoate/H(+) symporter BenE family transporter [Oricola cellulosilytica]|uniref:Benzoate transporter BenE n=1 Tax=Oricola cellulosilytica TaxID=1429082 RepID=A0A4R0PE23_9HYPH|nr:benzoate/H(+) symporter BenE family transporter [Oricola cellulosilytica]TCD16036.1 benzoate transporter BenE [Oricola cellulosilytica]